MKNPKPGRLVTFKSGPDILTCRITETGRVENGDNGKWARIWLDGACQYPILRHEVLGICD